MKIGVLLLLALALYCCQDAASESGETADAGITDAAQTTDSTAQDTVSPIDTFQEPDSGFVDVSPVADTAAQPPKDTTILTDSGPKTWRSSLFPKDWKPEFTDSEGRFLHDLSYAGYKNGEAKLPVPDTAKAVSVITHGADPTGTADSTVAIQAAINEVQTNGGGTVYFPEGLYRCAGTVSITASNVVLAGDTPKTSRVYFELVKGMSDKAHVSFKGVSTTTTEQPLSQDAANRSHHVFVDDASALAVGQDIEVGWFITAEFVSDHGMTGVWKPFAGKWQTFFRRTVLNVDTQVTPHKVTLDVPLRYPALVRDKAAIRWGATYLSNVGVVNLGIANAGDWVDAWSEVRVHAIALTTVKDSFVSNVVSFVSPAAPATGDGSGHHLQNGGIIVANSKRVTIANTTLKKPQNRGSGGCGYLFEIRASSEILTRDCQAEGGRHNFIQNWGFGATGLVWLRCESKDGLAVPFKEFPEVGGVGYSEFHHSLSTANLIDSCEFNDGFSAINRALQSSGAGHTATQTVFWNNRGSGKIRSMQYGWGYVIGTAKGMPVKTISQGTEYKGTEPEDFMEGIGEGALLAPQSLYDDQLARRLGL